MASSSLTIPFTFSNISNPDSSLSIKTDILAASSFTTRATVLRSWGEPSSDTKCSPAVWGAAVGCEDGTLYVYHQSLQQVSSNISRARDQERAVSHPKSQPKGKGKSQANSSSLHLSSALIKMNPRSRIVSGLTTEAVEAPKNYVDFDDEPEKLRDMLKGRNPSDRPQSHTSTDKESSTPEDSPTHSVLEVPLVHKGRGDPKSLLSATNSPPFLPQPVPNSSPRPEPVKRTCQLDLRFRIVPGDSNGPVAGVEVIDDNRLIVLHRGGKILVYSIQDGGCLATIQADETMLQSPAGFKNRDYQNDVPRWVQLKTYRAEESTFLLATASIDLNSPTSPSSESGDQSTSENSHVALFEYIVDLKLGASEVKLTKVGQWSFDGPVQSADIFRVPDSTHSFTCLSTDGKYRAWALKLLPLAAVEPETFPEISSPLALPSIANPFKGLKSRSTDHIPITEVPMLRGRISLGEPIVLGSISNPGSLLKLMSQTTAKELCLLALSASCSVSVYKYRSKVLHHLYTLSRHNTLDIYWRSHLTYGIRTKDMIEFFDIQAGNHGDAPDGNPPPYEPRPPETPALVIRTGQCEALCIPMTEEVVVFKRTQEGCRVIERIEIPGLETEVKFPHILWRTAEIPPTSHLASILPLELGLIIGGYADGRLREISVDNLLGTGKNDSNRKTSEPPLAGYIIGLHFVSNIRTKERFIVGGGDDGSVAFWAYDSLKLVARWVTFVSPLTHVMQFTQDIRGPLRGCVLCISQDGTIAVIAVDGFQFLHLIPGSPSPLVKVCVGADNLLLVYADHRARLWDAKTKEFWRSMGSDKADEVMNQGGWQVKYVKDNDCMLDSPWKALTTFYVGADVASTLSFDLERFIAESTAAAKTISTSRDQTRAILLVLARLRAFLSVLLTPGLNKDIDDLCEGKLGLRLNPVQIGFTSERSVATSIYSEDRSPQGSWCISGDVSAARALSIIALLRALSLFDEYYETANVVAAYYASLTAPSIGTLYQSPSLVYLARRWFDGTNELRTAARFILDYAVARLSDEEADNITEQWKHYLPCLQPAADQESATSGLALFLCGYIAAEKYSLLPASALTDISKSIAMFLHDETSKYRVLAVDLCSRGFHVWQHYVDTMAMLKALFALATNTRKEMISTQNVAAQARLAVLQIATSDTPLFMTTLSLDILSPSNVEHRRSVMQIIAFLIRKRPLVLQPNIPQLLEAVVKSLDPNSTTNRDAVLDAATEIIGHVVKTFPMVDFHMATQRLAVGSEEGAIVMYDLKTAIRLYVLEGHTSRITACSFSPDGRRLVTLSLEESVVLVWKVGSSFSSFFNPGAPPRQGHGGSEPFKTINFNVGSEADMTVAETMELVQFQWTADRNVKVKIRESVLTFSV